MEFGCIYNGYCSDMTRTVAVGHVTEEMDKVYHTVLKAQLAGLEIAKAGTTGRLFGAVTTKEVADALDKQFGIKVDKRKIAMDDIKSHGSS